MNAELCALLTSKETAGFLRVSEATLSRWRTAREGPAWVNTQGIPRYRADDLEGWISGNLENA
ncbi:helix-turn-helix transcriptional regulator [Microbacterium sp.]|uniref:helix-turn-helix transcriptional regulator n=1 Tax=Microbacterium sp. TaxID=51671 RepID=UPI003A921002